MFQENRSFDHYFGALNNYRVNVAKVPGATMSDVNTLDNPNVGLQSNPADDSAAISWSSTNATTVTIKKNGVLTSQTGNSWQDHPTTASLYEATATSASGQTATASVVVGVTQPSDIVNGNVDTNNDPGAISKLLVGASPITVGPGECSLLTWAATDGSTSVNITLPQVPSTNPSVPPKSVDFCPVDSKNLPGRAYGPNGSARFTLPTTPGKYSFTLTTSNGNSTSIDLTVPAAPVVGAPPAPTVNISNNDQGHVSVGTATSVKSFKLTDECVEDFSPDWLESHGAFNRDDPWSDTYEGNGFVHITAGFSQFANDSNDKHHYFNVRGDRNMGYYDEQVLPFYYFLATTFATSDNWFSPIPSNSAPNRFAELASTTAGHAHQPPTLDVKNIFQLLDDAGVSWKVYYSDVDASSGVPLTTITNFQWAQSNSQAHLGPEHLAPVDCSVLPAKYCSNGETDYFADLKSGKFPAVALIEPGFETGRDEHPGNPVQQGEIYDWKLMNAFTSSSIYKDSVFFLSYDEGGGFFDHVQPPFVVSPDGIKPQDLQLKDRPANLSDCGVHGCDFTRTGFRLPVMVVSPFVKPHYVSHLQADNTVILKFIEKRYNLSAMTKRDAAQPDLDLDMFDFTKASLPVAPALPQPKEDATCNAFNKNP